MECLMRIDDEFTEIRVEVAHLKRNKIKSVRVKMLEQRVGDI